MGVLNFEHLPISTLVGADRRTIDEVLAGLTPDKSYRRKVALTKLVQRVLSPLYRANMRAYARLERPHMEQSPIFIIGHWRSGTTYVHNIFTQDDRFGYCTTYQTVFPHVMLRGRGFLRSVARFFMPNNRATDGMELGVDIPQEEEVALSNITPLAHYHFLSSPQRMEHWRTKALLLDDIDASQRKEWQAALQQLVDISLSVQHKSIFLSKNPPHTARIRDILELWPDAKFIYLVRNPYTVFESTRNFFSRTIASTTLEPFDKAGFDEEVVKTYKALVDRYERDKVLIPDGNLFEVRFEDFEADPVAVTERIYRELRLGSFERVRSRIEAYVGSKRGFKKNRYNYDPHTVELVDRWCADTLRRWDYHL
ncbi:MAG: sulfotransferase [Alistipes sp.]|nr:sulfotransferase [Alistipes sp.]